MMNTLKTIPWLFAGALVYGAWANPAKEWTLADCIARAKERSLLMQSARLDEKVSASNLEQARNARLPDLSANVNQSLSDRPFAEGTSDHYSLSLGLKSSVLLWNAGQLQYNIEQKQYLDQAAKLSNEQTTRELSESVIRSYLQVWSLTESQAVAQEAVLLSQQSLRKDSTLHAAGTLMQSELALAAANLSNDSLSLLQASHALLQARTQLRQLLEIPLEDEWSLAPPDTLASTSTQPFSNQLRQARSHSVSLQGDSLNLLAADAGVKKANSARYPSISLSAAAGTGLSAWESGAYGTQLKTGYNHSLSLGISIPIVDWGAAQAGVLQAQVAKERSELSVRSTDKSLENTLEQLTQQTEAARLQWQAASSQMAAQTLALRIVNEKHTAGLVDNLALTQQKNTYQNAQAKLTQAKYNFLLGHALLALYTGAAQ